MAANCEIFVKNITGGSTPISSDSISSLESARDSFKTQLAGQSYTYTDCSVATVSLGATPKTLDCHIGGVSAPGGGTIFTSMTAHLIMDNVISRMGISTFYGSSDHPIMHSWSDQKAGNYVGGETFNTCMEFKVTFSADVDDNTTFENAVVAFKAALDVLSNLEYKYVRVSKIVDVSTTEFYIVLDNVQYGGNQIFEGADFTSMRTAIINCLNAVTFLNVMSVPITTSGASVFSVRSNSSAFGPGIPTVLTDVTRSYILMEILTVGTGTFGAIVGRNAIALAWNNAVSSLLYYTAANIVYNYDDSGTRRVFFYIGGATTSASDSRINTADKVTLALSLHDALEALISVDTCDSSFLNCLFSIYGTV